MNISDLQLGGRGLLKLADLSGEQILGLVDLAIELKRRKKAGEHLQKPLLPGKNICLVFQKSSTRTRCATVIAVRDEGGSAEYLGQQDIHFDRNDTLVGRKLTVLIDTETEGGFIARTAADAPEVDGTVFLRTDRILSPGTFHTVHVTESAGYDLIAE